MSGGGGDSYLSCRPTERPTVAVERRTSMRRTLVNLVHIRAFTEAMQRKDLEAMLTHMTH